VKCGNISFTNAQYCPFRSRKIACLSVFKFIKALTLIRVNVLK
jgi:hypothetical protein